MFEPMLETISGWLTYVAESVPSLQEPNEPLQLQETLTKEGMNGLLSSLKFPLSYGHQEFKEHWPHTPHEANLVIQSLHDLARALFGAREDDAVVASFLEKRGLRWIEYSSRSTACSLHSRDHTRTGVAVAVPNPAECGGQLCETQGHTFTHMQQMRSYAYCIDMQSRLLLLPS